MPRALRVITASEQKLARAVDTLILPYAQRQAQRGFVFGINGTCVEFDFPEPVRLRTDDALLLDDGSLVEIVAEAEPLFEVRLADPSALARLAWHLGDRHISIELKPNRLRVRRETATEALLQALGVKVVTIEAPFDPEGGAYAVSGDTHHHEHHHHDHHHGHHHHDPKPG